jgi:hypothetical protein
MGSWHGAGKTHWRVQRHCVRTTPPCPLLPAHPFRPLADYDCRNRTLDEPFSEGSGSFNSQLR